jgi:glycosyltransferase involved in cell wall biosynthesis
MQGMSLISIIIPIYKVEPYLRRCLDSILGQSFTDYECILIDDNSPDGCPAICDEYASKDRRFRVIHKPRNEGLPKARKSGLDIAEAEFVFHLDSDDWLEPKALELLYKRQVETDADIVIGNRRDIYPYSVTNYYFPAINDSTNILEYFFLYKCRNIWGKLYRKTLFDKYIVPSTNIGEDAIVNVQLFSKIKPRKLQKIDEVVYNYNHCSSGMTIKLINMYKYNSYKDDPAINSRLWMEEYIKPILSKNRVTRSAFCLYMVLEGINPYLRYNKTITRDEINLFYSEYYVVCLHKSKMPPSKRIIILIFHFSFLTGKIYVLILNQLTKLAKIGLYVVNAIKRKTNNVQN